MTEKPRSVHQQVEETAETVAQLQLAIERNKNDIARVGKEVADAKGEAQKAAAETTLEVLRHLLARNEKELKAKLH